MKTSMKREVKPKPNLKNKALKFGTITGGSTTLFILNHFLKIITSEYVMLFIIIFLISLLLLKDFFYSCWQHYCKMHKKQYEEETKQIAVQENTKIEIIRLQQENETQRYLAQQETERFKAQLEASIQTKRLEKDNGWNGDCRPYQIKRSKVVDFNKNA